jgi:quinoprotein glucose dehydrogenase
MRTSLGIYRSGLRRLAVCQPALLAAVAACLALALGSCGKHTTAVPAGGPVAEWPYYGGDPGGKRYSPLNQIDRGNVGDLHVAWVYHTHDVSHGENGRQKSSFEGTPIVVDGTLYLSTAFNRVVALDPETGAERWSFDPKIDQKANYADGLLNRGVATWLDATAPAGAACKRRIYIATIDARLISVDAATGKPCADFGNAGQVDLTNGIHIDYRGEYEETSPPAVIDDLVVVGSGISDNNRARMPSGVVRAFDTRTGALRWSWNPIPQDPKDPAFATWQTGVDQTGAGNAWSILSADPDRHLVFVPTGSPSPDYYGGLRKGNNLYADSVVALHSRTGEMAWGYQLVHHNLWDYDTVTQPTLVTLHRNGEEVPALLEGTKMGMLFILNRENGVPFFPVQERPVPQTDVPGEQTSPTQPFPVRPPPLVPQSLTADDAWGLTPWDRNACRKRIAGLRSEGIYTPPSLTGSLQVPGNAGGMEWGSLAVDPVRQLAITNTNRVPFEVHLYPRSQLAAARKAHPHAEIARMLGTPYIMSREPLFSPLGVPCNAPPWGALAAVDLQAGTIKWQAPLGATAEIHSLRLAVHWGTPNMGGPLVTAGGLVFIAAAWDRDFRAFDVETGKELWNFRLPASANATPMTYRLRPDGRQFVVIAAGGHGKLGSKLGDAVMAFTLP